MALQWAVLFFACSLPLCSVSAHSRRHHPFYRYQLLSEPQQTVVPSFISFTCHVLAVRPVLYIPGVGLACYMLLPVLASTAKPLALAILTLLTWPYWWAISVLTAAALELSRTHFHISLPSLADSGIFLLLFATATVPFSCLGKVVAAAAAGSALSAVAAIITAGLKVAAVVHGVRTCKPHAMAFIATVELLKLLHGILPAAVALAVVAAAGKVITWPGWWGMCVLSAAAADVSLGSILSALARLTPSSGYLGPRLVSGNQHAAAQLRQVNMDIVQSWLLTAAVASLPFTLIAQLQLALACGSHLSSLMALAVAVCKLAAVLRSLSFKGGSTSGTDQAAAAAAAGDEATIQSSSYHYGVHGHYWKPSAVLLLGAAADLVFIKGFV